MFCSIDICVDSFLCTDLQDKMIYHLYVICDHDGSMK